MKPLFLDRPDRWTRTPRNGSSYVDQGCAIERFKPRRNWWWLLIVVPVILWSLK